MILEANDMADRNLYTEEKQDETEVFERMEIDISYWHGQHWRGKIGQSAMSKKQGFFRVEKRNNSEPKCFGLKFTEDISIKNWFNRKAEDFGHVSQRH